jgi:chromosome partitioning protein
LENCKNIFDFFDRRKLSRRPLRLLPCLVDQRIRFEGTFRDPYQLLKAFAINRGYRCLDGFIAKSPKVESLNTNPEGKIYPILTHGRNTEVHPQFVDLARQVRDDARQQGGRRLDQVARDEGQRLELRQESFDQRRRRLRPSCLICGAPLIDTGGIGPAGYYCESSDGRVAGFLEEDCFRNLVFRHVYEVAPAAQAEGPLSGLFRESAQRSFFVLHRVAETRNASLPQLFLIRLDEDGREISRKTIALKESLPGVPEKDAIDLHRLAAGTLFDEGGRLGEGFLLIRRVGSDFPEEILYDEQYGRFAAVADRMAGQLS